MFALRPFLRFLLLLSRAALLGGWRGWLPPYFLFGFLKDLGVTVLCRAQCTTWISQPGSQLLNRLHFEAVTQTCIWWQRFGMFWEYLVCRHTFRIPLSPSLARFAIRIWVRAGSAGWYSGLERETFISWYPSHSVINPSGVLGGCTLHSACTPTLRLCPNVQQNPFV